MGDSKAVLGPGAKADPEPQGKGKDQEPREGSTGRASERPPGAPDDTGAV